MSVPVSLLSAGGVDWKVVPQSRTGGQETPITEFVMCSRHEQLTHVIGVGPQWATTNVLQKATVVCIEYRVPSSARSSRGPSLIVTRVVTPTG